MKSEGLGMEAKKLFFRCGGNPFLMERAGLLQIYKSYNISEEQEVLWRKEMIQCYMNRSVFEADSVKQYSQICGILERVSDQLFVSEVLEKPLSYLETDYVSALQMLKTGYETARVLKRAGVLNERYIDDYLLQLIDYKQKLALRLATACQTIEEYEAFVGLRKIDLNNPKDAIAYMDKIINLWKGLKCDS